MAALSQSRASLPIAQSIFPRDRLGCGREKTRVQHETRMLSLRARNRWTSASLLTGLACQHVQEDDLFSRIAVPAEMHDVRPVLVED